MSDDPRMVEQAAREAYELGILKEEDMDRSIRCMMETKLRLGVYDRENLNPYDRVTEDDIDSPKAREICKELSRESIVLLKNENGALPLDKALRAEDIALSDRLVMHGIRTGTAERHHTAQPSCRGWKY